MKSITFFALCYLFSTPAHAESFAFELEHFEPLGSSQKNILNLHQTKVLKDENFALSASFHFSNRPLSVEFDSGEERDWIENQLSANLSANLGLFNFFELGFSLPVVLNRSVNPTVQPLKNSKHTYLSDARIVGKIELPLDSIFGNMGVALVGTFFLPTGNKNYFSGFGIPRFEPRLVVDCRSKAGHVFAINLAHQSYEARRFTNFVDEGNIKASLGGAFRLTDTLSVLSTYSATFAGQTGSEADAAIRFRLDSWDLIIGGGVGVTSAPGIPDFRVITGFGYSISESKTDPDGDKIADDKCPHQPEDLDGYQDQDGCPEDDNDADGIEDEQDKCVNAPEDFDGFEDSDGCPDLDNDSDGVPDNADDCPLKKGDLKNAGCPLDSYFSIREPTQQEPR